MSKSLLLYLSYNNYYNRILKMEDSIRKYDEYVVSREENVNFNPGDGVDTVHLLRLKPIEAELQQLPDYMVELVEDRYGDYVINSRWFVLEATRTCAGQYELMLHRDIIVDKWAQIKEAPIFVEKAILNEDDPMIFNSEDMGFNEIKKGEILLKDETQIPWIVGYLNRKYNSVQSEQAQINIVVGYEVNIEVGDLTDYTYYQYSQGNGCLVEPEQLYYRNLVNGRYSISNGDYRFGKYVYNFDKQGNGYTPSVNLPSEKYWIDSGFFFGAGPDYTYDPQGTGIHFTPDSSYLSFGTVKNGIDFAILNDKAKDDFNWNNQAFIEEMIKQDGKVIRTTSNNKLYRIHVEENTNAKQFNVKHSLISGGNSYTYLSSVWSSLKQTNPRTIIAVNPNRESFELYFDEIYYKVSFEELVDGSGSITFNGSQRHLADAPYDMFCIPFGDGVEIYDENNQLLWESDKELSFQLANQLIVEMDANLYDIQILPYCPCRDMIDDNSYKKLRAKTDTSYTKLLNGDTVLGGVLWAKYATGTFDIKETLPFTNKKITNETRKYRLCSPNYASSFDFSVAKNNGVSLWNVDFTYMPFQPYIHVNPVFKGLYGADFNDTRGLLLNGDFSMAQIQDEWKTYQTQNKNYQNIFDRQIESMEYNNRISKTNDILSAITGSLSAGTSGAGLGMMLGGGIGAAIGGVTGTLTSAAAGIADTVINTRTRKEALDLTKDQFGYELGNIKARPYNLTKTTGYTANNKYFPFIEIYEATDVEIQALINKITYNGMTVMRIGEIGEFLGNTFKDCKLNYFKGKLIRLQLPNEEFHFVNTIANELNEGIYIPIEVR